MFTLTGRQEHVAVLTVHPAEGLLLVRILVRHVVWQKTAKESKVRVRGFFFFISTARGGTGRAASHSLRADATALSVRKAGASTPALFPLEERTHAVFLNGGCGGFVVVFFFLENVNARGVWSRLGCLTSASMWVKLLLLLRVDEAVASRIWVRISLWSTSCVSGWVSTATKAQVKEILFAPDVTSTV